MRMRAGVLLSTVLLLFAAEGLRAAPLFPGICAHDSCVTTFIEYVSHRHHGSKSPKFPPIDWGQCPYGMLGDGRGHCFPMPGKRHHAGMPPVAQCGPGQNMDPNSGVCFSCSHNDHFENGRCVPCQLGFHVSGDSCVAD